jgi:hypothetical protein
VLPELFAAASRQAQAKAASNGYTSERNWPTVHIISKAGGISYDDDPYDLGLTLYRRGGKKPVPPEELKAKVDELLAYLQAESRIYMDDDRRIHVRTSQSGTESVGLAVAAA